MAARSKPPANSPEGMLALRSTLARETAARQELERASEERIGQEKRRLAEELHDTLGQSLTAVDLNTKFLERKLEKLMNRLLAEEASTGSSVTEQGGPDSV